MAYREACMDAWMAPLKIQLVLGRFRAEIRVVCVHFVISRVRQPCLSREDSPWQVETTPSPIMTEEESTEEPIRRVGKLLDPHRGTNKTGYGSVAYPPSDCVFSEDRVSVSLSHAPSRRGLNNISVNFGPLRRHTCRSQGNPHKQGRQESAWTPRQKSETTLSGFFHQIESRNTFSQNMLQVR